MQQRIKELVNYSHDCTEDESAEIKRLLDDASFMEREALAERWPLEWAEWCEDREMGRR